MTCKNTTKLLSDSLNLMFEHLEQDFLIQNKIRDNTNVLEASIIYFKNHCFTEIGVSLINRLEYLLKVVQHFFNIRKSVNEVIINHSNLKAFINTEIKEIINQLTNN